MITQLAKYTIVKNLTLILVKGSVVHFAGTTDKSAIVNAANAGALGGGGVDGAISAAGGHRLYEDRAKLPVLERRGDYEIRCRVGSAVMTGPGDYGELQVPYVIHAVGPNYNGFDEEEYDQAHDLLKSAYSTSLDVASENRIEQVAFSLLSAGIFRGYCSLAEVLGLGVESIVSWGKAKPEDSSLAEIYIVAFTARECATLKKICDKAFGVESEEEEDGGAEEMDIPAAKSEATSDTAMVVEGEDEDEKEADDSRKKESMTLDAPEKEAPKEEKPSEKPSDESKNDKTKTPALVTSPGETAITNEKLSGQPSDEDGKTETPAVTTSLGAKPSSDASDKQLKEKSDEDGTTKAPALAPCPEETGNTDASDKQLEEKSDGSVKADTAATPSSPDAVEKTEESNSKEDEKVPVDEKVESTDLADDAHMSKEFEHRDAPDFAATIKILE